MMRKVQRLIIGAGPSGLAVAHRLQGDTLVLESEEKVGGLCRSVNHRGGTFDIGGHSFHTPHIEVANLVDGLLDAGLSHQRREARVYVEGTLIPYPFQRFYGRLKDPEVVNSCREGLKRAEGNAGEAENLEDYIIRKFGDGIAEHFMLPYNRKLWARDLKKLSCEWTSERVAASTGGEKFKLTGGKRKPLQPDTLVGYPQKGGFEEIFRSFVPHLQGIELNSRLVHIDTKNRIATTAEGNQFQWEFLVSTLALPLLLRMIGETPAEVQAHADSLDFMSLRVELLLAGRQLNTPVQRIYVSDPAIPAHKIVLNHNSSDTLRSRDCHAIMAEVSISDEKPIDVSTIAPSTIGLLQTLGILESARDIAWQGHLNVKYAYPVYTLDRPGRISKIKTWLSKHHIYTLGRFGEWEYINSDKCIMKGLSLGRDLRALYPARHADEVIRASR